MNSRERFVEVMDFGNPDRTMIWEFGYWAETIKRWYKEGLPRKDGIPEDLAEDKTVTGEAIPSPEYDSPRDVEVSSYLGFDKGIFKVPIDNWIFPPFKKQVLGRLPANWPELVREYKNRDYPIAIGGRPVGFFGSLRDLMGLDNLLFAYYDNPKLIKDILAFLCDFWINLWSEVLSQIEVDYALIWEDMSYKSGMLVSPKIFREFMLPHYKKLTGFLLANKVKVIFVDSDGDCRELIPLLIEGGVTGMNPFEVQAGMDIVKIRKKYPKFQIMAGLDKRKIALGKEEIDKELETKIPFMLREGGYIPFADHLIPPDVSWNNFVYYRRRLKEIIERPGDFR